MVDGKDDIIKWLQITSHISAQWIVAEQNNLFYYWLYRQGVLELMLCLFCQKFVSSETENLS